VLREEEEFAAAPASTWLLGMAAADLAGAHENAARQCAQCDAGGDDSASGECNIDGGTRLRCVSSSVDGDGVDSLFRKLEGFGATLLVSGIVHFVQTVAFSVVLDDA
jgi:hypothetical protein